MPEAVYDKHVRQNGLPSSTHNVPLPVIPVETGAGLVANPGLEFQLLGYAGFDRDCRSLVQFVVAI